jgi:cytochrome c551/c552
VRHAIGSTARLVISADKLRFGGNRHWGERFNMWPQTNLGDEDAYVLVDWVLSQH